MNEGDVALACVSLLVDELVRFGMRHACVSPGSRSTPVALALERDPRVSVHVHLDERASAFFALGIAKATGTLVAVACTSGTAAAELFPAVVEASQARVPLVMLTADRPPRLRGTGANQTIDQTHLYGGYTRWFVDAPPPEASARAGRSWREIGARAAAAATADVPGPVHVNLPFEEPLSPEGDRVDLGDAPTTTVIRSRSTGVLAADVDRTAREFSGRRGVVAIGEMPRAPTAILVLADRLGWPVLAEPTSGARRPRWALAAGQALAGTDWVGRQQVELVLQVGATPTSRATQRLVASSERLVVVDRLHLDPDPERRASARLRADPEGLASALLPHDLEPSPPGWLEAWRAADAAARHALDDVLDSYDDPYEERVARDLAASIPEGGTLVVGSSLPIRDLDYAMAPREVLRVLANRGASGIDGFVSTALGVAATGSDTYALCGDLTLLHDVGSLIWSARRGSDAVFVVPNNGGGAIFSFLPQRSLPEHERLFTTPHGVDLGAVCAAAGAGHTRVERAGDLVTAIAEAAGAGGVRVIEVPSDPERNVARHNEVQEAVGDALRTIL